MFFRHSAKMLSSLGTAGVRTGRWWFPVVVVLLGVAALVGLSVQVVVPTATYVLF
jgi:hypothetical protein